MIRDDVCLRLDMKEKKSGHMACKMNTQDNNMQIYILSLVKRAGIQLRQNS
jgi:hypothetical protein